MLNECELLVWNLMVGLIRVLICGQINARELDEAYSATTSKPCGLRCSVGCDPITVCAVAAGDSHALFLVRLQRLSPSSCQTTVLTLRIIASRL
jgi:hypothetical protein